MLKNVLLPKLREDVFDRNIKKSIEIIFTNYFNRLYIQWRRGRDSNPRYSVTRIPA